MPNNFEKVYVIVNWKPPSTLSAVKVRTEMDAHRFLRRISASVLNVSMHKTIERQEGKVK